MSVPLLAFLLALLGLARADDAAIVATKYKVVDAEWRGYHAVGDELVGVKVRDDGVIVQRWDLAAPALKSVAKDDLPTGHRIEGLEPFGKDLVFFSTHWDPKERAERLYRRTWDRAAGRFSEPTLAFAIPGKLLGVDVTGLDDIRQDITPRVKLSPSQDGRGLLASWRPAQDDEKPARLGFALFGKDLAVRWQVEVEIPLTIRQFYLWDEAVDNAGDAWFLIGLPEEELEDRAGRPLSKRVVAWRIPAGSATPEPILFELPADTPLRTARLAEVPGKGMFVAGVTSTPRQGASGLFMGRLAGGNLVDAVVHPLPPEVRERTGLLAGLELDEVTLAGDGHLVLLAEEVDLTIIKGQKNEYKSRYGDMLVAHLAPDGRLHWVRPLRKTQVGTRRPGSLSHVAFDGGGHLRVLYLDDLVNLSLPEERDPEKYADGEHGQLVSCRVDDAGEITRRAVLTTKEGAGRELHQLDLTRIVPVSKDSLVVEAYVKQGEDQLIRVALDGP